MTDRVRVITIVLDKDYRDDDFADSIVPVLRSLRFVSDVQPHVATGEQQMARATMHSEIKLEVYTALERVFGLGKIRRGIRGD